MMQKVEIHLCKNSPKGRRLLSRRLQDRRLWERIEQLGLEKAAYCLIRGFSYLCWGGGRLRVSRWSETRNGYQDFAFFDSDDKSLEFLSVCKRDYLAWCDVCEKYGLNRHAVMDVLYFGVSLAEVDKSYGRRHGWCMQNILEALALYRK